MRSSSVRTTGVTNCRQHTQDCDHDNDGEYLDDEGDDDYSDGALWKRSKSTTYRAICNIPGHQ